MTEVKPTADDQARLKTILETAVLPGWIKRCGARCGDIYNEALAPITGVRYAAR